ncbi:DUF4142 domain-containing protein [Hymenobacter sp. 5317J-9]|uniref:DUF4142 domain-containing protein n=1 Tax=Hymenobacter sp. 5317J-9 TaxID=2932250 RepID=UPI001FD6F3FE|nr:DUF4142 domain-containing protein [Hymenobacter sp. 5317J-9]UOQ97381.1 DUF4142 domain-containing protein [Hymenobacter sp. 5317J-9]
MKAIPSFLLAGVFALSAACSSTSTSGTSETATSSAADAPTGVATTTTPDASAGTAATDASADATAYMNSFASMSDAVFLTNAASSDMMEIRAGQMASQKATSAEVRKYAQMMVSQHNQSSQELKAVAAPLGVKMPDAMLPVHQALADRLMNKSGKNFDETYMDLMETAHKMDVAMFEVKSTAAESPNVQAFATKTLPVLRSHYDMANSLEKKVD